MPPLPSVAERTQIGSASLSRIVLEAIVSRGTPARPAWPFPVGDYVSNTFGALQGGVMALLGRLRHAAIDEALG